MLVQYGRVIVKQGYEYEEANNHNSNNAKHE
jgi:hypothetical protein